MDIQKEREAFESWWESFHNGRQISCDYVEKDNSYAVGYANAQWVAWQAKAQAVPKGFVLIKDDTKTVVAIERMVEQQVEASGMDSRRLERLDGWKIIEAAVKAQEPAND
ncbi:hypothetical protein VXN68_03965 [Acinetobacter schindleri]|uniref:hypothetical protein n=1 Tax=Acinetobacter schindleri TaxID=108981 RepID=UPI003A8B142F